jgi:hypothetical protein
MTKQEWMACTDPAPMLGFLRGKVSDRKLRLFACACCRNIWHLLTDHHGRAAVEGAECYADGQLTPGKFARLRALAHEAFLAAKKAEYAAEAEANFCRTPEYDVALAEFYAAGAARATVLVRPDTRIERLDAYRAPDLEGQGEPAKSRGCHYWAASARSLADQLALRRARDEAARRWGSIAAAPTVIPQADLLRDIFGNPFHPSPPVPPAVLGWHDGTVRRLAQAAYDERQLPAGTLDAGRLGVLADAMLDAGCEDEELVRHCREPGPHVRGCWAVDAIIGRE